MKIVLEFIRFVIKFLKEFISSLLKEKDERKIGYKIIYIIVDKL